MRTRRDRGLPGRLVTSAILGCVLVAGLLGGPPAAAQARTVVPTTAAPAEPSAPTGSAAPERPATAKTGGADDASCGGPVEFGAVVACPEITGDARHRYTVTTTVDGERVAALVKGSGHRLRMELTGPDDTSLCDYFWLVIDCAVPKAGTYTLTVESWQSNAPAATSYVLGVDSRTNPSACVDLPAASFAFSAPGTDDKLPAGSTGRCYRFDQPTGAAIRIEARRDDDGTQLMGTVESADGRRVCNQQVFQRCVLSGTGPYRLFLADPDGNAAGYHLSATRMSQPDGCREMSLAPFGGPGEDTGTGTLDGDRPTCLSFAASAGPHLLVPEPDTSHLEQIFDAVGREVTCVFETYGQQCALPADGTYTLVVRDTRGSREKRDFTAAIYPLAGTRGCVPLALSGVANAATVTIRSPMQVDCHLLDADPGDVVVSSMSAGKGWLTNKSGTRLCVVGVNACKLSGAGPFRIVTVGRASPPFLSDRYRVSVRLQSDVQGCQPVAPSHYGDVAGGHTSDKCRVLVVPRPGRYHVELVDETNKPVTGTITDRTGTRVCDTGWCTFPAAGRYRLATPGFGDLATVFLPEPGGAETGCHPVSDDPTAAAESVSFHAAGQYNCRVLPTPAGAALMLARPRPTDGDTLRLVVQDDTGAVACDLEQLTGQTCVLRGEAPFRVLASRGTVAEDATDSFAVTFVRVGGTPACPALAAEPFGTDTGTNVEFDIDHHVRCFSVPAGHSATEAISFRRTDHVGRAKVSVFGADGAVACRSAMSDADFALCRLAPGPATILVEGDARYGRLVVARRDAAATAGCSPIGSTAVGAPSTAGTLHVADVQCHRVPAESTDRLMIGARDERGAVRTYVVDPTGAEAPCAQVRRICSVTGSAGYQVLVWGPASTRNSPYQLDAWTVWSARGPAAGCTEVPSLAYGFGPYTGTLSSTRPATCLVTTQRRGDELTMRLANPAAPSDTVGDAGLFAVTAAGPRACAPVAGTDRFTCPSDIGSVERTAYLLTLPGRVSEQPYAWEATCGAPPCGDKAFAATGVSPTALIAGGPRTITIKGTSLHRGDTVRVTPAGRAPLTATVTAVSADRTVLTAQVDLTSAPAGQAAVEVRSRSAGVAPVLLPAALRITLPVLRATKAPTITGRLAVGATVTAVPGQWSPAATSYTYRWAAGGVTIKGATGRTYAIPATMLGKRLTVSVTASRVRTTSATVTSVVSAPVARGVAPKAAKAPVIRGAAKVGRTVTVVVSRWTPQPDAYRFEWRLNGVVVRGATRQSLKLTTPMRTKRLTVTVVAVRKGHVDGRSTSGAVTVVR